MKLFQQNQCLNCFEVIAPIIGWRALFSPEKEQLLCPNCEGRLEKISGETCRVCSRPFSNLAEMFRHGDMCHDCKRWEEDEQWKGYLEKNVSLYLYNDFLKELIARYKFRGDYVLAKVFAEPLKELIHSMNADLLVPIPLSKERLYERGFNQAAALLVEAGYPTPDILSRIHSEKQSKKSRSDRIQLPQVFEINPSTSLQNKKVVLMDDIYTTGSTLRHAAKLIKEAGAASVQALTLAR
jgi:competence protein ComFC